MATAANGVTVPAGSDVFQPQVDMTALNASLHGRIMIPAANATARVALIAGCGWAPTAADPLVVLQTDIGAVLIYDGTRWHYVSDRKILSSTLTTATTLAGTPSTTDLVSVTVTTLGGPVTLRGYAILSNANSGANRSADVYPTVDGTPVGPTISVDVLYVSGVNWRNSNSFEWTVTPAAGSHTFTLRADASMGAALQATFATLTGVESY